jgi:hypothetical protein
MDSQLASLRRLLRIHLNWLTVVLLGKELVSAEDLAELKKYGKLSLGEDISFIEKAFSLGRLSSTLKTADYEDITLEKLSRLEKKKFSSIEKLAIREAKLHAGRHMQAIADEVQDAVYDKVNTASNDLVNDVLQTLKDETAVAVAEKKTAKELASSLSNIFNTGFSRDWKKFATTELHRAKVRGAAMAIANKVDIYSKSAGVDSDVSVVPNRGACDDCRHLYLDESGNPKVFKLKELVATGTNASPSVKHTRNKQGLHSNWKAVMPPAHPHCFCSLVYVPPGMEWENGKLKVVDDRKYKEHISKAVDTGSMSPVIKPPGPKSSQKSEIPKPGSIKGVPAPDNQPGPGIGGSREGFQPCPFGGDEGCVKHGGDGAKTHKVGGSIAQAHAEYLSNTGANTEEQNDPQAFAAQIMAIKDWKPQEYQKDEILQHLEQGEIISSTPLGSVKTATPGITTDAVKVDIAGNGSALLKPELLDSANKEVGAYKLFSFFGSDLCPVTGSRMHKDNLASAHSWLSDFYSLGTLLDDQGVRLRHGIKHLMDTSSDPEGLKEKMSFIIVMDTLMNNKDRHLNNVMVTEDFSDIKAIDHGFAFGVGYRDYKQLIHEGFNSNNMKAKVPSGTMERFSNTSVADLQKALGGRVPDWQVAQVYLRMKYAMKIQEEHGHLPYSEFITDSKFTSSEDEDNRQGPNEKFEDFAIDFIDKHGNDPSSPEFLAAKSFMDLGIFMHREWSGRAGGQHFEQEKLIRVAKAVEDAKRSGKEDFSLKEVRAAQKAIDVEYTAKIDIANKEYEELDKEVVIAESNYVKLNDKLFANLLDERKPFIEIERKNAREVLKDKMHLRVQAQVKIDGLKSSQVYQRKMARESVYKKLVPPGQEDTFNRLNAAIDRSIRTLNTRGSLSNAVTKFAHLRAKKDKKTAADIEQAKTEKIQE